MASAHTPALPFWSGEQLDGVLREPGAMGQLIRRVGEAFAAVSAGACQHPPRSSVPGASGVTLLMGAAIEGMGRVAKVVSVFPGNPELGQATTQGLLIAMCPDTGRPLAMMDAARLTAWRTGAAAGLATDRLAAADAHRLGLIGAGAQALTQAHAVCAVRTIDSVRVFSRSPGPLAAFCRQASRELEIEVEPAQSSRDAMDGAQVVCVATTSSLPVLDGSAFEPGTHINAVGSFRLSMRELDRATLRRARIVVDERATALAESGELVDAIDQGITTPNAWVELGEVAAGTRARPGSTAARDLPGRDLPGRDLTVFKSVGHPAQDVAAAAFFLARLSK